MQSLLNDTYYPITSSIAFLEADLETVCTEFLNWQKKIISDSGSGYTLEKKLITGNLQNALSSLLPLNTHEPRRHLFLPTQSRWVAYFNNFVLGTDAVSVVGILPTYIKCRSLLVQAVQDSGPANGDNMKRRYGATVFDLHGPVIENYQNTIRKISLINEGKKWVFYQKGDPLPFESVSHYDEKEIKKRFSFDLLHTYASALGLDPFNEDFYLPPGEPTAVLIEKLGPLYPNMRSVNLDEI